MRLLLIEQDPDAAGWLASRLEAAGFKLSMSDSCEAALRDKLADSVAAILIELAGDGHNGTQIASLLRSAGITLPIVMLSARTDWREKVASLDAGADDYIIKPVRSEEIAARLRVAIRRSMGLSSDRVRIGEFELDQSSRCAWLDGRCLELTRNEFLLLRLLLVNAGNIVSHQDIRAEISPGNQTITLNAIEVQVARLRKKIGPGPIRTVRGLGYRYNDIPTANNEVPLEPCRADGCDTDGMQSDETFADCDLQIEMPARLTCPTCGR